MPFSNLGHWPRSPVQFGQCKVTLSRGFNWNLLQWWGLVTALERHLGYAAALCSSFSRNSCVVPTFLWFLIGITELFNLEKTPLSSSSPTMKLGQLVLSHWFLINLFPESLVLKTNTWAVYLVLCIPAYSEVCLHPTTFNHFLTKTHCLFLKYSEKRW